MIQYFSLKISNNVTVGLSLTGSKKTKTCSNMERSISMEGMYHQSGRHRSTWYEVAVEIVYPLKFNESITPNVTVFGLLESNYD